MEAISSIDDIVEHLAPGLILEMKFRWFVEDELGKKIINEGVWKTAMDVFHIARDADQKRKLTNNISSKKSFGDEFIRKLDLAGKEGTISILLLNDKKVYDRLLGMILLDDETRPMFDIYGVDFFNLHLLTQMSAILWTCFQFLFDISTNKQTQNRLQDIMIIESHIDNLKNKLCLHLHDNEDYWTMWLEKETQKINNPKSGYIKTADTWKNIQDAVRYLEKKEGGESKKYCLSNLAEELRKFNTDLPSSGQIMKHFYRVFGKDVTGKGRAGKYYYLHQVIEMFSE